MSSAGRHLELANQPFQGAGDCRPQTSTSIYERIVAWINHDNHHRIQTTFKDEPDRRS